MAFNPLSLLQLKEKRQIFKKEHPDMSAFGKTLKKEALRKGSTFAVRVTTPDGKVIEHELTMTENDVEMIRLIVGD